MAQWTSNKRSAARVEISNLSEDLSLSHGARLYATLVESFSFTYLAGTVNVCWQPFFG